MAVLTIREYGDVGAGARPFEPLLFSRTDSFSFSPARSTRLRTELVSLGGSGICLSRVSSSGHEICLTELDRYTLLLPVNGRIDVAAGNREYRADPGQALGFRPNSRRTRVSRAFGQDYLSYVLTVPMRLFKGTHLPFVPADAAISSVAAAARVAALRDLADFLFADLSGTGPAMTGAPAMKAAEALVLEQFRAYLEALSPAEDTALASREAKVRQAEDYMRANHGEALTTTEVARAVGIGARCLQASFRQFRETTPWSVLTGIRLRNARELLLRGGDGQSVTQIALACGFAHLGRFAQIYRATYGEPPSATLRRTAGATG